eukprot:6843646-Prymnesium_polylepis.1
MRGNEHALLWGLAGLRGGDTDEGGTIHEHEHCIPSIALCTLRHTPGLRAPSSRAGGERVGRWGPGRTNRSMPPPREAAPPTSWRAPGARARTHTHIHARAHAHTHPAEHPAETPARARQSGCGGARTHKRSKCQCKL